MPAHIHIPLHLRIAGNITIHRSIWNTGCGGIWNVRKLEYGIRSAAESGMYESWWIDVRNWEGFGMYWLYCLATVLYTSHLFQLMKYDRVILRRVDTNNLYSLFLQLNSNGSHSRPDNPDGTILMLGTEKNFLPSSTLHKRTDSCPHLRKVVANLIFKNKISFV